MGHVRVYTISDALARYYRMKGHDVVHPMGWDAFGLPAENAAMQRNVTAAEWTEKNIEQMREQLRSLGFDFDWSRELRTCAPEYYRWTQWLFLQMYDKGLATREDSVVWWDPVDKTTLANEQVDANGNSWRSGAKAERVAMPQWKLRITAFAESLLDGLDGLDGWPEEIKQMQRNWIGPSDGVRVRFRLVLDEKEGSGTEDKRDGVHPSSSSLDVFTTRVDTLFGVTYLAVAPEHPLSLNLLEPQDRARVADVANTRGGEGGGENGSSSSTIGARLPLSAVHPVTGEHLPVYVAAYVLSDYGEGAVMAVPAHDTRDALFAEAHGLPTRRVVDEETGRLENSNEFDGMTVKEAAASVALRLEREGFGKRDRSYRLRDWCVSRQRRWGAPIPVVHCDDGCGAVPVSEKDLPVRLPVDVDRQETDVERKRALEEWSRDTTCPKCGSAHARRDTDTLDTFVDSSWYFLRFLDGAPMSATSTAPWPKREIDKFMPVSEYIGGVEHAVMHLLYSRFVTHFLHSCDLVPTPEPFESLLTQGMVLGQTAKCKETGRYFADETEAARALESGKAEMKWEKMSKSKHNGVNPLDLIDLYGADVTRLSVLFAAPPDMALEWSNERSATGCARWVDRLWRSLPTTEELRVDEDDRAPEQIAGSVYRVVRPAIEATDRAFSDSRSFNVAIATLMKLSNDVRDLSPTARLLAMRPLLILLAPMAPHLAAEMWDRVSSLHAVLSKKTRASLDMPTIGSWAGTMGRSRTVHRQPWPSMSHNAIMDEMARNAVDESEASAVVAVQIGGKMRGTVEIPGGTVLEKDTVESAVYASSIGERYLDGSRRSSLKRVVFVKKKDGSALINFVL